jgi:PAS domain S-box-containing protein
MNTLTSREREIMSFVILGKSNKEIAKHLRISYRTVEVHRLHIMQKTGSTNLIELLEFSLSENSILKNKLIESEVRFNLFLDALPAIAFIKDDQGNIIFGNKCFEESSGIKNWQKKEVHELFSPKVATKMSLDDRRALRAGQIIIEERVPNAKGEIRLYQTTKFCIPISNKKVFLGGISVDVTDSKNAENALKKSNALLADTQAFAHLGSWWWNTSTGENTWSDEQYKIYGYEPGSIIPSHDIFINAVIEEDRAKVIEALENSLDKQASFEFEFQIRLPDDSIKSILSRGYSNLDASINCIVVAGTDLDISRIRKLERQHFESEERYRYLLEDQTELICRFKIDGTILYVNSAFCNMFGKSRESLIGHSWAPVAHPDDLSLIFEKINSLTPANDVVLITNRVFDASSNIRMMQFINRAFFDTNSKLLEIQSVGREVTEMPISQ